MSNYDDEETILTPTTEDPPQTQPESPREKEPTPVATTKEPTSVITDFKDPEEERKRLLREKKEEVTPQFASVSLKKTTGGEFVDPEKNKQSSFKKSPSTGAFTVTLKKVANAPADLKGEAPNVQPQHKSPDNPTPILNVSLRKTGDPESRKPVAVTNEAAPVFSSIKLRKAEESSSSKDTHESKDLPEIVKPSDLNPSLKEKRRTVVVEKEKKEEKPVFAEVKLKSRPESMFVGTKPEPKPESTTEDSGSSTPSSTFGSIRLKKVENKVRDDNASEKEQKPHSPAVALKRVQSTEGSPKEKTPEPSAPVFAHVKLRSVGSEENSNDVVDEDPRHAGKPKRLSILE